MYVYIYTMRKTDRERERERDGWIGNPANHMRYLRDVCEHMDGVSSMDINQRAPLGIAVGVSFGH